MDKLTLAALEATLRLYRAPERARQEVPTLRYLARSAETLEQMARELAEAIRGAAPDWPVDTVCAQSQVGGGSLPGENLPTTCVRIGSYRGLTPDALAAALRDADPPIFARIHEDAVLLDPRTMEPEEYAPVAAAVGAAAGAA